MNGGEKIVPAANVAELVCENCAKLRSIQAFQKLGGKNQDGSQKTDDARLLRGRYDERVYGDGEVDGRAGSQCGSNSQPTAAS
jgi:hypothetical protein